MHIPVIALLRHHEQRVVQLEREHVAVIDEDANKILQERADLYKNIIANDPSQQKFANGWQNRLTSLAGAVSTPATPSDSAPDQVKGNLEQSIAQMVSVSQKLGDNYILGKLADAGHGAEIEYAQKQGYKPSEIVARFGGAPTQAVIQAQQSRDQQGVVSNVIDKVKDMGAGVSLGARQIGASVSGDQAAKAAPTTARAGRRPARRPARRVPAGEASGCPIFLAMAPDLGQRIVPLWRGDARAAVVK